MRVAALYDIHGNDAALAAVLAEVDGLEVDLIVVGGDVAGGPFPRETVDAVRALGGRAVVIRGNGERELVEARLHLDAGTARIDPDDVWSSRTHWAAGVLDQERLDWMGALPPLASVDVDGLGDVLFCHASPRSDEEIVTPLSPEARILPMLADVAQRTVALGHTHVQFDREIAGRRLVNAGSVGMPYEGDAAAFWALLGPGVELRRTSYDVTVTCARIRESGIPDAEEFAEGLAHPPPASEANEFFERMATRPA
ncbi:MAG: metallophosphatase family protein [Actinomycetota bacterium]|nr:metallophosphatase family protein [Actinomycetota bacterium]